MLKKSILEFIEKASQQNGSLFPYLANMSSEFDSSKDTVYYSGAYWDLKEVEAAMESLLVGKWMSSGEKVNQFERRFSKKFGFNDSLMVNSGSSANLVMIAALKKYFGWKDGDEIIVSVVGFPTTVSSIIQNNLKPIFVDIDWQDLNWDLDKVAKAINNKTKAVFSSPVLGNPYDVSKLIDICSTKGVEIIADNCDSLGSKWDGNFLTDYSVAASCSFYPAHHISTMEGGMVSSKNEEIVKLARSFAWWGRGCYCVGKQNLLKDGTCKQRFSKWIPECEVDVDHKYVIENIGYNLKPLDLQGAIGIVQLDKFDEIDRMRRFNKERFGNVMSKVNGCRIINELSLAQTSWFGLPVVCDISKEKSRLVTFLENNRIQTRNYFAGNLLMQPGYKHLGNWKDYPNASEVLGKVFFMGVSPTINDAMYEYIKERLESYS